MDIKDLDKKQLVLLTLLITFVVSIATGIITVSLMNQMPKSVPQTINNVIQRTIEKVTTVEVPAKVDKSKENPNINTESLSLFSGNSEALVSIYLKNQNATPGVPITDESQSDVSNEPIPMGQGIIISEIGLVLVDSNLIKEKESYKVILNKIDFDATVLKRFDNGFTVLKISPIVVDKPAETTNTETPAETE